MSFSRQSRRVSVLTALCALLLACSAAVAMQSHKSALGTTAAVDPQGRLWIAYAEGATSTASVYVRRSKDFATWDTPILVNATAEPVSSDGENRPKLAFDKRGGMYVTWTSPTSAKFTGDIRFTRSLDGGKTWSKPTVVHRDRQLITHRFESLVVDPAGTIWITWVDKRDLQAAIEAKREYAGAAVYYAYSTDRGATWQGDFKLADHTCECCRIGLGVDANGRVAALWRHVFANSERDHAFAFLTRDVTPQVTRATYDRWNIDACPHHGPSLAFATDGTRHAVWFNQVEGAGRAFYGQLTNEQPTNVKPLAEGATHADIAVAGNSVAIAWKRFDGEATRIESWLSSDGGKHFTEGATLRTEGDSDQPRLVTAGNDILLVWRRSEGVAVQSLLGAHSNEMTALPHASSPARTASAEIKGFERDTLKRIEQERKGKPFWLVLWDLECTYCMKSLKTIAQAQRGGTATDIVTISTDSIDQADTLRARLAELGVQSEAYAFASGTPEALRFAIDPKWLGEKPRAYLYAANGTRTAHSGVMSSADLAVR